MNKSAVLMGWVGLSQGARNGSRGTHSTDCRLKPFLSFRELSEGIAQRLQDADVLDGLSSGVVVFLLRSLYFSAQVIFTW